MYQLLFSKITALLLIVNSSINIYSVNLPQPNNENMYLYRYQKIQTGRPHAFDVDSSGILWQGWKDLYRYNPYTGSIQIFDINEDLISSVFSFKNELVLIHPNKSYYTLFNPTNNQFYKVDFQLKNANVWFGLKASDKLFLFDRSIESRILVLDNLTEPPKKIPIPDNLELSHGFFVDNQIMLTSYDNLKLLFFDPIKEQFSDMVESPFQNISISGAMEYQDIIYLVDSAAGRILPFDIKNQSWLDPISASDYGKIYGYIGSGFQFENKGYFNLSTYRFQSRINRETGEVIYPKGWDIGVDGKYPRFLDKFLIFDAETKEFSYLTVPPQDDGTPLICYAKIIENRVFITGYIIPYNETGEPSKSGGDWIVWQNFPHSYSLP